MWLRSYSREKLYYLFAYELLDSIPFQKILMAFVHLEQFDYFISLQ